MLQQSSQIPQDEQEEGQLNNEWAVQDMQNQQNFEEQSSGESMKRPSRRSVKIKSRSSIRSRPELIKVSKIIPTQQNQQKQKNSQIITITGQSARECRICLQGQSEGRLVRPCRCTGSMQYAHERCLSQWIKRKMSPKQRGRVPCQVCEEPFQYKICKRLSVSFQILKQNFFRHKSNYICFIIVMAVLLIAWLAMLSVTCMGMSDDENWVKQYVMTVDQTRIIFICVLIVYVLIMFFVSLLFIAEYGIKTEFFIKNVRNHNRTFRKVVPKMYSIAT